MTAVVTSCSAKGWASYGRRFVETFHQYWPAEIPIYVVSEDEVPYAIPLSDSPMAADFLQRHEHHGWAHGDPDAPKPDWMPVNKHWRPKSGYCFRHDAYKFSKKVFAIELMAGFVRSGKLFWIDADVITFAPVPNDFLDSLLPNDAAISYLERQQIYPECGFVGYNLDHPATHEFIARFAGLYARDEVFRLREWHDSWVFDWLRAELKIPTYSIPHKSNSHPFVNSALGQYMDHLKGRRKKLGRTRIGEQVAHRHTVDYWKG